jgi:hypothetical protein
MAGLGRSCHPSQRAETGLSPRHAPRSAERTNRTRAGAAIADAAFVRNCSGAHLALQHLSPKQPFKSVTSSGSQTDFSPHGAGTPMSRTSLPFAESAKFATF